MVATMEPKRFSVFTYMGESVLLDHGRLTTLKRKSRARLLRTAELLNGAEPTAAEWAKVERGLARDAGLSMEGTINE
jgi:hypothetical protein